MGSPSTYHGTRRMCTGRTTVRCLVLFFLMWTRRSGCSCRAERTNAFENRRARVGIVHAGSPFTSMPRCFAGWWAHTPCACAAQARVLGVRVVDGLSDALELAKRSRTRCIAVSNAPRAACEYVLDVLRSSIDSAGEPPIGRACVR